MRCRYLSDLHLETQSFDFTLPKGDVLIIAGDLCHARCLDPKCFDRYGIEQRGRVLAFIEQAVKNFTHVLAIAGNHEHYDGVFDNTIELMRLNLPGVTVLNNQAINIGDVKFFGATLWTDFDGGSAEVINKVRRRIGDYFFVKKCSGIADTPFVRFQPEDALKEHRTAWNAIKLAATAEPNKQTVIITHHAPSLRGLDGRFAGNGLDTAYASSLDKQIETFQNVPVWVHGHTHIAKSYRVGNTAVRSNALGFASSGKAVSGFSVRAGFEL